MVDICFYFQVHQPHRLKNFSIFEIGKSHSYFNDTKNEKILRKVAQKCYIPANNTILDLIHRHGGAFKVSYSISGCILDQFERFMPEMIESFNELVKTGCVELLDETYYHSLASVFNKDEFVEQVKLHNEKIQGLFRFKPRVFRNTELVYSNDIAKIAEELGYIGVLGEGFDRILEWRSPNFVYKPVNSNIKLLLRNHMLSDDIAFRFGNTEWKEFPLTADKFATWINSINGNGQIVNLFMDYETFGEHQWAEKGIFEFLKFLPGEILKNIDNGFVTPSEAFEKYGPAGELDIPALTSWADTERDLTAWLGNKMQQEASQKLYEMRDLIIRSNIKPLIDDWRKLQTSDHFYYMCTKWFSDGDVHKYFNPFDTPYDALISFMNILNDLRIRLKEVNLVNGVERKWLTDVQQDQVFWLRDGDAIKNILELSSALRTMEPNVFDYHVNAGRNDFATWVKVVVGDDVLAKNLEKCNKSTMAAKMVEERIKYLKK